MFSILFPYSYVAIGIGLLIGIGITAVTLGCMSAVFGLVLIYAGIVRITPIIDFLTGLLHRLFPEQVKAIQKNIYESFKIRFTEPIPEDTNYIYAWHPHGVISMSHFFHILTPFTGWPNTLKPIQCTTLAALLWLPFAKEVFEYIHAIPSEYYAMKGVLEKRESISLALGGMREMLGNSYIVKRRRGIFKMALETGTPIVPVLSFGENTLFSLVQVSPQIQKFLEPYDVCICIPTLHSLRKWLGILQNPLKDPITSVAGKPIPVQMIKEPTESDIAELRERYIAALKDLFLRENPNPNETFSII